MKERSAENAQSNISIEEYSRPPQIILRRKVKLTYYYL